MAVQPAHDPSLTSYYVTDAYYRALIDHFSNWQRDELAISDVVERERFRMLVEKEARLLDQLRFDEWLALYTPECLYWVPTSPQAGDPRREVSISFDDRRRMEDRVYRLRAHLILPEPDGKLSGPSRQQDSTDKTAWPIAETLFE